MFAGCLGVREPTQRLALHTLLVHEPCSECSRLQREAHGAIDYWGRHVENLEPPVMIEDARLLMEAARQAYADHSKSHGGHALKATGYTQ
jgi:hypothetical protein